jgi:TATA-binding protein-associated factor Taf7
MARGWESKAVSDQIEEGQNRPQAPQSREERSPETVLRRQELESLKLSRSRTLAQMEQASRPAYRQMLERALRTLENQIEDLSRQLSVDDKPKV